MFNSNVPYSVPVAPIGGGYGGNGLFGGGDSWAWILILALLFGWGGNGNGAFGGGGFQRGFDNQAVVSKLDGLTNGLCDSTFALNNTVQNGFFNNERGLWNLSSQFADCCCQTQRAIEGVNYNMAKGFCDLGNAVNINTRDLLENQNNNTKAILDFLTKDKIDTLTAENQALKFQASQTAQNAFITANQDAQTAELIRRIAPMPVPSYAVPAPYPYGGYGNYNSCGCC